MMFIIACLILIGIIMHYILRNFIRLQDFISKLPDTCYYYIIEGYKQKNLLFVQRKTDTLQKQIVLNFFTLFRVFCAVQNVK